MIGILGSGDNYFLAGDVFLKNFFSVWDDTNSQISFAPHSKSSGYGDVVSGTKPSTYLSSSTNNFWTYVKQIIAVVVVSLIIFLIVYFLLPYFGINIISSVKSKTFDSSLSQKLNPFHKPQMVAN